MTCCTVIDCDRTVYLRGWCTRHYLRWRRHGDPTAGRTLDGAPLKYLLDHMWDDDCPKWPFFRNKYGRPTITYKGNRGKLVARVVCEMVHGAPPTPLHEAAHSCGKGHEGCFGAKCLSWKTRSENVADAIRHGTWNHGEKVIFSKLTEVQAREILKLKPASSFYSLATPIAEKYGVSQDAIAQIWLGKNWAWLERDDIPVKKSA